MEIHYKVTTWNRIVFPDDVTKEEVIAILEKGDVGDLWHELTGLEHNTIEEVEELITVEENDGEATVELFAQRFDDVPIWDNSIKKENNTLKSKDDLHYKIKFKGFDRFKRPVYKVVGFQCYFGDTETLFSTDNTSEKAIKFMNEYYRTNPNELQFFGREFNCNPVGSQSDEWTFEILEDDK